MNNFARYFLVISLLPMSLCVRLAGQRVMHCRFMARNLSNNCPFGTGNGYGDGRAISVFEGIINGQRWEMQLKGGGPTPYCRGAEGRAVLRSSVREFLAQDYMQALGVPTSRSLTLYVSKSETVTRPWYSQDSQSFEP